MRPKRFTALSLVVWIGVMWAPATFAQVPSGGRLSLFVDHRARQVGDVLTIYVVETALASNEARTSMQKEQSISVSSDGGSGILDFIPLFNAGVNNKTEYKGDGLTSRKGSLRARISARITRVLPNGDFEILGTRTVNINNDKQITEIKGIVRPRDITADNIVYSYNIADAEIVYRGKGPMNTGQRPGLLFRLINWFF